jgi:hypothetical protein
MSNSAVIDAWADMKPWIEQTLPGLAQGSSLPNNSQNAGNIGACNAFNSPGGTQGGAIWGSDGDATITLTSLKISSLAGVKIQPASFVNNTIVHLPFSFSNIEVQGNYGYAQPCALYDLGKKASHATANGHGNIVQTINNNSLIYVASFDKKLTLTGAIVNGNPSISVHPDTGGLPDWLVKLGNFLSVFKEADVLRNSIQNVFLTAGFSQTAIAIMNKKLGGQ